MRRRLHQAGFTLLELLIAITLLGLILVLLFGGLRLGVRSWDAGQESVDNMSTVRAIEGFLRREMSQVNAYRWKKGLPQRLAFLGERHKVSFVAPLPSRVGGGGLYVISLELEQKEKAIRIVWRHRPVTAQMADFSVLSEAEELVLGASKQSRLDEIWFTYYGQESDETEPRWLEHWQNDKRLPKLIRIQVRLDNGEEWPEFVVAPMLMTDQ